MATVAHNPSDLGAAIRAARLRRGLRQTDLASLTGTTRQWIGLLERGHGGAELGLVLRVAGQLGIPPTFDESSDPKPDDGRTWMTAGDCALAIRDELGRGDIDFALRMLSRFVADYRDLNPIEAATAVGVPASTGDHRWDALLAAVVARECRAREFPVPRWTDVEPLEPWWFPDDNPVLTARYFQHTPTDLSARGIFLDARSLESL